MSTELTSDQQDTRILIVEDSRTQAVKLQYLLEESGFRVQVAYNGVEALAAIDKNIPTLIISDIVMPEIDGYELCRRIRADKKTQHIPVILLTSLSSLEDVIQALESGADNFVTKPYKAEFLLSRIHHIMVNREIRKAAGAEMGIEIFFTNHKYVFASRPTQVIDLLLSTFESAVQKNQELQEANQKLLAMQHELTLKNRELEALSIQKDHFLGMAAHDLRNPLGHIATVADILLEDMADKLSKQERELLEITKTSSQFMLDLVNDLLDIAKIESGKLRLKLEPTNLITLIEHNVMHNRSLAEKKDITLTFQVDDTVPEMLVDRSKMEQILNNLISNAVKFSFPHTTIAVRVALKDDHVLISVSDQGQGIPANELDRLFQPFERTSVTSTAGERSTGLGLAIVKKIVEGHQGKIWVESKVSEGSTFYVSLPVQT